MSKVFKIDMTRYPIEFRQTLKIYSFVNQKKHMSLAWDEIKLWFKR